MTTPKNTMQQDTELEETAQQAAKEEEAAKAAPRLTVYTHKFEEPFSWNGRIYKELTFNFAGLIGQDCMAAEQEVNARGITLVTDAFCLPYLCAIAARACTERDSRGFAVIDSEALGAMPLAEFRLITGRARAFLLQLAH